MTSQPNRRRDHFLGLDFDVSVKWLIVIIVMGLVQFGTFLAELKAMRNDIMEIKLAATKLIHAVSEVTSKDIQQDTRIGELERRLNVREERLPLEGKHR